MKRKLKSMLAIALSVAVMVTFVPMFTVTASAATNPVKITVEANVVNVGFTVAARANQKVTWKSGNKKIATVNSKGVIKGKKEGTVKITAVAKSKKKASVKIKVVNEFGNLNADQIKSINSIRPVYTTAEGRQLFEMNYYADTKTDEIIDADNSLLIYEASDGAYEKGLSPLLSGNTKIGELMGLDVKLYEADNPDKFGCSAFTIKEKKSGDMLLARNYDIASDIGIIVHTPADEASGVKYASVGIADPYAMLGVSSKGEEGKINFNNPRGKEAALLAPWALMDGVNSEGFTVSVFQIDEQATDQKNGNPKLSNLNTVKVLLDKAANVDEAIEILKQFDSYFGSKDVMDADMHFMIADKAGHSAMVEYVNDKMYVTDEDDPILNLSGLNFNAEGVNDFWYLDSVFGPEYCVTEDHGGVSISEDLSNRRVDKPFQIIANHYISKLEDGTETVQTLAGEGIDRYNTYYAHLDGKNAISKHYAMNCLKHAKFCNNDGDAYLSEDYLSEMSTAEKYWQYYQYTGYFNTVDEMHAYLLGAAEEGFTGWLTVWSAVYDTNDKNIEICFGEDYSNVIKTELPMYE